MRVLIVEDEYMIASETAAELEEAGCVVAGIAASVAKALAMLVDSDCDVAVIDANLNGQSAEPVAAALQRSGIPYLVVTGYGRDQLAEGLATAPFLAKPYSLSDLVAAVLALRPAASGSHERAV